MHFPDFAISKITPKDGLQGLCKEVKSYSTKTFKELNVISLSLLISIVLLKHELNYNSTIIFTF